MRKIRKRIMAVFVLMLLLAIILYNMTDNYKINIVSQEVTVEDLPKSFEGFTILQLSDLHGKRFGKAQKKLIDTINSLNYDIIAITGDMRGYSDDGMEPFYEMLEGIKNKDFIFYVKGNHDLPYYDKTTKNKTEIGRKLEEKDCKFVDYPYSIRRGQNTLWVSGLFSTAVLKDLENDIKPEDIKIAITHYPMDEHFYKNVTFDEIPDYDLILAGHYHGGQFRIPFYGAVFIPNVNKLEFFPKQSTVSGLMEYGNYKQYVSRGLGASSKIPFLRFRLFNTPEINLITLVKEK